MLQLLKRSSGIHQQGLILNFAVNCVLLSLGFPEKSESQLIEKGIEW